MRFYEGIGRIFVVYNNRGDFLDFVKRAEELEYSRLSRYAAKAGDARRKNEISPCPIRTAFARDRDRILHCKAFRRLMHKTQVFISPEGDHFRTRLTHTLEVAQIARTICRGLNLNEDLAEAISLAHDLGHTPFGHGGEDVLDALLPGGFRHNEQSVRVVEVLEGDGCGLNLTDVVIDGVLNHRTSGDPATLEGRVVQIADKIAYVNHDIDDAIRAGILSAKDLPEDCIHILGETSSARINLLICDIIANSQGLPAISMSPLALAALADLRKYMFANVYTDPRITSERQNIDKIITTLFTYFTNNPDQNPTQNPADYIAGMTDRFAKKTYDKITGG